MRKPERRLYDTMKRHAPEWAWLERVENSVGTGTADVAMRSVASTPLWVELKATKRPKRNGTPLLAAGDFRPDQLPWHKRVWEHGDRSVVLVRDDALCIYVVRGCDAHKLLEIGWHEAWLIYGFGPYEWPTVYDRLRSIR